jgi:hypothetical protein
MSPDPPCAYQAQLLLSIPSVNKARSPALRPGGLWAGAGEDFVARICTPCKAGRSSSRARLSYFWQKLSAKLLHRPLDINALATLLADERFDDAETGKRVEPPAMWTLGATDFRGSELPEPRAGAFDRNCIDYHSARVAFEISHVATFLDDEATVALRASGDFVRDDQVAAFVLMHDLGLWRSAPDDFCRGSLKGHPPPEQSTTTSQQIANTLQ